MTTDHKTGIRDSLADADLFARAHLRLPLHDWQGKILYEASKPGRRRRIAVRAPNGAGKDDRIIAPLALWWLRRFKRGQVVITTADEKQLNNQTWVSLSAHKHLFGDCPTWRDAVKWKVNRFHGGSASPHPRYKNLGSYIWHEVAQKIRKHQIKVPDNQKLIAQLSTRRIKYAQDGKLWIETKQEMRERGLESPDLADAFVMAFGMQPAMSWSWLPFDDSRRQEIARRHDWIYPSDDDDDDSYKDRRTWNGQRPPDDTPGFGGVHSIW